MLTAPAADPIAPEQLATEEAAVGGDFPALVDRLQAKLGAQCIRRPRPRDSWIPERSEDLAPASSNPSPQKNALSAPYKTARPILLLDPPEPAEGVLSKLPDYPPRGFTWRAVRRRIVRAQGPERVSPEWWRDGLAPTADADRPVLKVAREDVEHLVRQGSRKVSNPGVCVPALPNATGLEGRRGVGLQLVEPDQADAVPKGLTLDGFKLPFPLDGGRWPRGAGSGGGALGPNSTSGAPPSTLVSGGEITPIRPSGPPSPIKGEGLLNLEPDEDEDLPPLPRTRDYFLVEDEAGERFWLFRDGLYGRETAQPTWWVHGVFA
jgi:hypothetical protein